MRAARTSLLLVAFALLASALHLTLALPAEIAASEAAAAPAAEEAASETVSQRDPEEHPAPAAPAFHLPRPSEIIHAVGSYVHGAHQQHAQEHHEEVHEQVAEHHEQHHEQHEHHHPTTHRPHHRPPHRPLHPEKEKIKVTKTVLVEFTKLVTRHPVCMKVYGVKPPCLPFQAYSASGAHQPGKPCNHGGIRENDAPTGAFDDEEEGVYADAELKEGLYISPSAVAEMPAATNIVEAPEDLEAAARSARYLELRAPAVPAAPAAPAPVAAPASATPALPVEQSGRQHLIAAAASAASSAADNAAAGVGGLLGHRKPEKIVEYKTLWVTKVEKVWDHRVTATLVAENCVPTDLKIPFCGAGYGPTFEGGDEIVYKPVKPAHKPIHKPVHKPVHHEPVHKPVHHEPVHKPVHHEPVHKPVHHEPVHKPVHHEPEHKPVHHEPVHKPVHHEPVHKPVHHEPVHKPVHHEPEHKPVHHEPVHKPVHHEPVHKPVHHEPVHKPVHHEPVHKPVHHEPVHKPAYKPEVEKPGYVEYSETEVPVDHHWKEGEDEVPAQEEAVAQASVENEAEEKPAFD